MLGTRRVEIGTAIEKARNADTVRRNARTKRSVTRLP
jgi:hypothetical protein